MLNEIMFEVISIEIMLFYLTSSFLFVFLKSNKSFLKEQYEINFQRNVFEKKYFNHFIWKMSTHYCLSFPICVRRLFGCYMLLSYIENIIFFDQITFLNRMFLHIHNHAIMRCVQVHQTQKTSKMRFFILFYIKFYS